MIASRIFPPGVNDLVEMLKDNLTDLASQPRRTVVFELLSDIETVRMHPILELRVSLYSMHVHRFIALIRAEREPPALHIENSGHQFAIPL